MKKKCSLIVCILLTVTFCSCGGIAPKNSQETVIKEKTVTPQLEVTQTPEERSTPEPTEEPYEVTEKKNIEIGGRLYTYAAYARTVSGTVTLMSLKTDEDVLYIPSEIEGDPVVMLGWPEETKGVAGYEWSDQIEPEKLGWNGRKKRLKKMIISEGIERIENLFCSVDEIIVPESMIEIENSAFASAEIKKVVIKSNKVGLGMNAFEDSQLEEIQFPDDFRGKIGNKCFCGSHLKSFRWPAYGRQKIGDMGTSVFEGCRKLQKITFPENQERIVIPQHSFFWCTRLTKLEFPETTKKVVYKATHYADNYKYGVSTLVFKGKNTKVEGGDIRDINLLTEVPEGKNLLTVKRVIAPPNSKAVRFAKKAVKIADMNEWKPEDATCENGLDHPAVLEEDLVPVTIEIRN